MYLLLYKINNQEFRRPCVIIWCAFAFYFIVRLLFSISISPIKVKKESRGLFLVFIEILYFCDFRAILFSHIGRKNKIVKNKPTKAIPADNQKVVSIPWVIPIRPGVFATNES